MKNPEEISEEDTVKFQKLRDLLLGHKSYLRDGDFDIVFMKNFKGSIDTAIIIDELKLINVLKNIHFCDFKLIVEGFDWENTIFTLLIFSYEEENFHIIFLRKSSISFGSVEKKKIIQEEYFEIESRLPKDKQFYSVFEALADDLGKKLAK